MKRVHWIGTVLVALGMFASGCYGPFNLTRRLYHWNEQVSGKWEREFVFILLAWAPVYSLAVLGDAIVFNAMEFWTGKNPVDAPRGNAGLPQTKRIARGESEAVLTYRPAADHGGSLMVEQFHHGWPAGSLRIQQRDGVTVGYGANGKVLLTAQTLADGRVVVRNGSGRQVAAFPAEDVTRAVR